MVNKYKIQCKEVQMVVPTLYETVLELIGIVLYIFSMNDSMDIVTETTWGIITCTCMRLFIS